MQVDGSVPPTGRLMLLGLQTAVRPVAGDTYVDKATDSCKTVATGELFGECCVQARVEGQGRAARCNREVR